MTNERFGDHVDEDDLVALALGLLSGERRAKTLMHVNACPICSAGLEQSSLVADVLLQMAPEIDPPVGFEVRVLQQIQAEAPKIPFHTRYRTGVAACAAAVIAVLAGFGVGHLTASTAPATTAANTTWSTVYRATLTSGTLNRGSVSIVGSPCPWVLMDLHSLGNNQIVRCEVQTVTGSTLVIGHYRLYQGGGAWGVELPFSVNQVRAVVITSSNGSVLARTRILT